MRDPSNKEIGNVKIKKIKIFSRFIFFNLSIDEFII